MKGFSLLEATVALALLAVATLLATALVGQLPFVAERIEAKRLSYELLESSLEAVRAGRIEPGAAPLPIRRHLLRSGAEVSFSERITQERMQRDGLTRLRLEVTYQLRGQLFATRLETLLWRPR